MLSNVCMSVPEYSGVFHYFVLLFVQATFYALQQTYAFLSPELWKSTQYSKAPLQEFTDFLAKPTIDAPKPVDNTPTY